MVAPSPEKIGLALSGGGLRASFFHIGILAQMAEQGLLQSIEVISCVSGGSIIGALYYLHLKELLESTPHDEISNQDYIKIIKTIEVDFLKATEKNIRMNVLADFRKNFQMKNQDYSRSDRIAELYNEYLYQSVLKNVSNPVAMQQLKIQPYNSDTLYPDGFDPETHNSNRKAKVPMLVLNATTLNGGRNWQFTPCTMGEPPMADADKTLEIDKKPIRLRRATGENGYQKMLKEQQNFPLGHAVAASACVPGLFDPLAINNLYNDRELNEKNKKIVPQLVDGGVFDNQGTDSLLSFSCTHSIVSDASGQMGMENQVATDAVSVLLRVASVLQDRTRTEGLLHLKAKKKKNIAFIDLRRGLGIREISWNSEMDKAAEKDKVTKPSTAKFHVNAEVQEKLSFIRTDLDAFTEVEAYSLMLDGYLMSEKELATFKKSKSHAKESWKFNEIAPWMENPTPDYLRQLDIAKSVFGKSLQVFPWLWTPVVLVLGLILYYFKLPIIEFVINGSIPIYLIIVTFAVWLMNLIAPKLSKMYSIFKFLDNPYVLIVKRFFKASLLVVGTIFVLLYLKCINPMYLAQGRVSKLKK